MTQSQPADDTDSFRPETYWDGGGMDQGDATFGRVAAATPMGGGEYLPPLEPGEVEIVMIGMSTTQGDVVSVRARPDGDRIVYRVVDEAELEYGAGSIATHPQKRKSFNPSMFNSIIDSRLYTYHTQ